MDVSMHVGKDYTDSEKHDIINDAISGMYEQLKGNATNVCTYNSHLWAENLLSDTLERFLKRSIDAKWKIFMQGKLERYLTSGMSIALHSSTSPFFSKYRKHSQSYRELLSDVEGGYEYEIEEDRYDVERKELWEDMSKYVDTLNYYDKYLIQKYYYEGLTLSEISDEVNITSATLAKDLKKALHKLKTLIEKRINDE